MKKSAAAASPFRQWARCLEFDFQSGSSQLSNLVTVHTQKRVDMLTS